MIEFLSKQFLKLRKDKDGGGAPDWLLRLLIFILILIVATMGVFAIINKFSV